MDCSGCARRIWRMRVDRDCTLVDFVLAAQPEERSRNPASQKKAGWA
jgi:hypothetical protein